MAGDWIQMRVYLARDPKVIRMADWLASQREFMNWLSDPSQRTCQDSAYECVTRNVTVALCVTGLLVTWGTAREQGDRDFNDLILDHCDLDTISAVSDIPLFGRAMEYVNWAVATDDGRVIFPNFFRDRESPHERHKRRNAERQERFRKKHQESNVTSNVTSNAQRNVTVTHREEKRREEKSIKNKTYVNDANSIHQQLFIYWNKYVTFAPIRNITGKRATALDARLKEAEFANNWTYAIDRIPKSAFLRGENDSGWKADIDWFLKPGTVTKILEGKYDHSPSKQQRLTGSDMGQNIGRLAAPPGKYDNLRVIQAGTDSGAKDQANAARSENGKCD